MEAKDCPGGRENLPVGAEIDPLSDEELQEITDKLRRSIQDLKWAESKENPIRLSTSNWRKGVAITAAAAAAVFFIYSGYSILRACRNTQEYAGLPGRNQNDHSAKSANAREPAITKFIPDQEIKDRKSWPNVAVATVRTPASPPEETVSVPTKKNELPARKYVVVAAGENLSTIAQRELGSPEQWSTIWNCNRDTIKNPDRIKPGQRLEIVQAKISH